MKNKPFGLDIGATTMKVVWLSEDKSGFFLNACSVAPTPPKAMLSEALLDQQEMANAITILVSQAKITTVYVNLALPESSVYTRVLEMPVLSDKELSSAIYWEAEQYISVPLTSLTINWRVLRRPKQAEVEKMQVLLVGAPTALINKYQKVIEMAGLIPNSLETEILSVVRAIAYPTSEVEGEGFPNSLLVHIGAMSTLLTIVKNGLIIFTYVIPVGGTALDRAIAADFGFTASQAEEYKRTYGYSSKTFGGKIGKTTEPILQSILTEMKKALAFYSEKYKTEAPIKQIMLSGGTAKLPGIDLFFAQNCGIETVVANPWKILANQQMPKEILDDAPSYAVAIGLAMKDYE